MASKVTDLTLSEKASGEYKMYPSDADKLSDATVEAIRDECARRFKATKDPEFRVMLEGHIFRVRREETAGGAYYFLRAFDEASPLNPHRLPGGIITQLESPKLSFGGLVLIAGAAGAGKSTTASSTVISRLRRFGGVAWTIEDPIEFHLEGHHGDRNGICWQKEVNQGEFAQAMRNVMRCYPADAAGILFVGEIRDAETADQCLRAASNGLLVIATVHAGSLVSAIDRLVTLTTEEDRSIARNTLADNLRLVVFQRRHPERPKLVQTQSLWLKSTSNASMAIRSGKYFGMNNDLQEQKNRMAMGQPVC